METLAPPAPQQTLPEQDVVLTEQEQQITNSMELRHQLENPDEMRIIRQAVAGKTDEEATAIMDQYFKFKIMSIDGPEMAADVNNMKPKYGDDVISNVEHLYMDYVTMPDDQFEQWAADFSKPTEVESVDNTAAIEAEKTKLRFKYGEKTADTMGDEMLQKEAERSLGLNKPEETEPADEAVSAELPAVTPEAVQEPLSKEEAVQALDEQLKAFHMKVNERVDNDADLSVSEYTETVNGLIAAFDKFAEAAGLSDEEKAKRMAMLEKEVDRRKGQLDQHNEQLAARKAEVNAPAAEATESDEANAEEENTKRSTLRNRWNALKMRGFALMSGDLRGGLGSNQESQEGKLVTKRRLIGAAVLVGAGVLMYANNKNGWGLDINPFDGDGLDLNPFNKNPQGGAGLDINPFDGDGVDLNVNDNAPEAPADAATATGVEATQTPELVNVQVDPGEGTSHIARDQLGINFESADEWNQFNARTNPLFEGVDGFYQDAASGEWRVSGAGGNNVPREILDEMQRVAEEIKTSRAA